MELILLSIAAEEFISLHNKAGKGDQQAIQYIERLCDKWIDREISCFLCDGLVTERPICTQVLPEFGTDKTLIGAPLCETCRDLPQQVRWSRSLRVVKKMFSARTGKNVTFQFNARNRHPHRR